VRIARNLTGPVLLWPAAFEESGSIMDRIARNAAAPVPLLRESLIREAAMNADLIETRAQALDLLDAEMITFGMYVALCRFKGWQT
jgi:hypothetical protein